MSHVRTTSDSGRSAFRFGMTALLLTVIGVVWWTWHNVNVLKTEAQAAVDPLRQLKMSPKALDDDRDLLMTSGQHAKLARQAADSLPLRVAGKLPFIGDDVRAARTLATAMDNVVNQAGVPLVDLTDSLLTTPKPKPGQPRAMINTAPLKTAGPVVLKAAQAVRAGHTELEAINVGTIADQLSVPLVDASNKLGELDTLLTEAYTYLPLAQNALGANGARDYLLVFQNLAEARPTGGLIGKWAVIRVENGSLRLLDIGANENLVDLTLKATPPMPADFMALYGKSLGPVANANLTPNFPDAAKLILATWKQQGRKAPAGVISVDTRAIAGIMGLTGPISVGDVFVGADNVVEVVQSSVYSWYQNKEDERQKFLSAMTSQMLHQLSTTNLSIRNLASTLAGLVSGGEIVAYSPNPTEQRALAELGMTGALPPPSKDTALLYFTDNGGSKLDHYLHVGTCSAKSVVGVTLNNTTPGNYAKALPAYVLNQRKGTPGGNNLLTVALYVPADRGISSVTVNGQTRPFQTGTEAGWSVIRVPLSIPAQNTLTVRFTLSGDGVKPGVRTQPLTHTVTAANSVCK